MKIEPTKKKKCSYYCQHIGEKKCWLGDITGKKKKGQ